MLCAISGTVPEEPVVSRVSGHLYEKRLVLKIIAETGRDPVTDEPLSADDLIDVVPRGPGAPRPAEAASVPALLRLLQSEWDAAALEMHALRSALHEARKELAATLYQHDAATRVIARLVRERDGARQAARDAAKGALEEARRGAEEQGREGGRADAGGRAEGAAAGGRKRGEAGAGAEGAAAEASPAAAEGSPAPKKTRTGDESSGPAEAGAEGASPSAPGEAGAKGASPSAPAPLPASISSALELTSKALSKARRKRPAPAGLASSEAMASLSLLATFPGHRTRSGGSLALAASPAGAAGRPADAPAGPALVASGGADGKVVVVNASDDPGLAPSARGVATLAHGAAGAGVTALGWALRGDLLASGGSDGIVQLWRGAAEGGEGANDAKGAAPSFAFEPSSVATLDAAASASSASASSASASSALVGVSVHPSSTLAFAAHADACWRLWDLEAARAVSALRLPAGEEGEAFASAALHPDGLLYATGTDRGLVKIWEVRAQKPIATLQAPPPSAAASPIAALAFSENGYHLASAGGGAARTWDLRKLAPLAQLASPLGGDSSADVSALAFDASGRFLAATEGRRVGVYGAKQGWELLGTVDALAGKGQARNVAWGTLAKTLVVGGGDHNLRIFKAGE